MTHSIYKGDIVIATKQNTEGLTPGKEYTVTYVCDDSPIVKVIREDDDERLCYCGRKGTSCNDVELKVKPVVAPVALMTPVELVGHQQRVTAEALSLWNGTNVGALKPYPTVVGGAPRDWDYMIPAQDIDIWVKNSLYGDEDLQTLKDTFEPLGGEVNKVTANTYARDGEYIHYIFNVMWQGVDLQFIFVEDCSVQAVVDHVCCNFSEIAWEPRLQILQPTPVYKMGRRTRTLVFRDDKGRSPRDCYIDKMAKRYKDHAVVLPKSSSHLEGKYNSVSTPVHIKEYVIAKETDEVNRITKGKQYEFLGEYDSRFYKIIGDQGDMVSVFKTRFMTPTESFAYMAKAHGDSMDKRSRKMLEGEWKVEEPIKKPEITTVGCHAPDGYSKFIVLHNGRYWRADGCGSTPNRAEAHIFSKKLSHMPNDMTYVWVD